AEESLRDFVLERAEVATGTRSFSTPVSLVQGKISCVAGALSLATRPAIRVWSGDGFCKRAARVVAADDLLFPPALVGVAVTEHRCERFACRACWCRDDGARDFTGEHCRSSAAV